MKYVGYYNGEIGPYEEMTIPMSDRSIYFGDGCYDATTFCNQHIFALNDHLDRFYNSCKLLEIDFKLSREELTVELNKCIEANECDHGMIYWQCTRGCGVRSHVFPPKDVKPNLLIISVPLELVPYDTRARLITMEDTRYEHCNIKTLNLIPNVMAAQRCVEKNCFETVFHRKGIVTECAHSNVLILKDGVLQTHELDNHILPGVTLKHLLKLAPTVGLKTKIKAFTLDELFNADEIIVSSSGGFCIGAYEIDGKAVGGKDNASLVKLQQAYDEFYKKDIGLI